MIVVVIEADGANCVAAVSAVSVCEYHFGEKLVAQTLHSVPSDAPCVWSARVASWSSSRLALRKRPKELSLGTWPTDAAYAWSVD